MMMNYENQMGFEITLPLRQGHYTHDINVVGLYYKTHNKIV